MVDQMDQAAQRAAILREHVSANAFIAQRVRAMDCPATKTTAATIPALCPSCGHATRAATCEGCGCDMEEALRLWSEAMRATSGAGAGRDPQVQPPSQPSPQIADVWDQLATTMEASIAQFRVQHMEERRAAQRAAASVSAPARPSTEQVAARSGPTVCGCEEDML